MIFEIVIGLLVVFNIFIWDYNIVKWKQKQESQDGHR